MNLTNILTILVFLISSTSCRTNDHKYIDGNTSIMLQENLNSKEIFKEDNFPDDWVGEYQGNLDIFSVDSIKRTFNMKLSIIKKTDSMYSWVIEYDINGKKDIRPYELLVVDKQTGHYLIDEKNSIKIDGFYRYKTFNSLFKVMGNYIVSSYEKKKDSIIFEILSASDKNKTITGNGIHNGEDIPEVTTNFITGRQKAVLVRLKN